MALFRLNSDIQIGTFRFSGVEEVCIKRSLRNYCDYAKIRIPSIAKVQKGKVQPDGSIKISAGASREVITGKMFTDGDPVTIKLGYNGEMHEEFRGFVRRRNLAMPLEVECEGYVRQLRLDVNLKKDLTKGVKVKDLLLMACQGTDISVQCPVDMTLTGITLWNANGVQVLEHIKRCSAGALNIFFLQPDVLWCGLVYTPYLAGSIIYNLPTVNYRLGYNVVKDNGLRERIPSEPVQIIMNGKLVSGDLVRTASKDKTAACKVKHLMNNVKEASVLQQFAQELEYNRNYIGYEGCINGFLQPYALPGYNANIVDARYPERNGVYIIESTEVIFGVRGARRRIEVGPKLG
jgi:hypothetical protein